MTLSKPLKVFLVLVLFAAVYYPVKWYVYYPWYYPTTSIDAATMQQELLNTIAYVHNPRFSLFGDISESMATGRPLTEGENIHRNYANISDGAQRMVTSHNVYVFQEKGRGPSWKSCLYKENDGQLDLVKIPANCSSGIWLKVIVSNKSPDLVVEDRSGSSVYIIKDSGEILEYNGIIANLPHFFRNFSLK